MEKTTLQSNMQNCSDTLDNNFSAKLYESSVNGHEKIHSLFIAQKNVQDLLQTINYQFKNTNLLVMAFTHRSFVHEYKKEELQSYERLEFLGDSILGAFVSKTIVSEFKSLPEGDLSKLRSSLVNEDSLYKISVFLGLDQLILLGRGELLSSLNKSVVSDVFEALIGALALDSSFNVAFEVMNLVFKKYEESSGEKFFDQEKINLFDPKTKLQEETMKRFKVLPVYESTSVGEEFEVSLVVCGAKLCSVQNISKKVAMKELAKKCLEKKLLNNLKA